MPNGKKRENQSTTSSVTDFSMSCKILQYVKFYVHLELRSHSLT